VCWVRGWVGVCESCKTIYTQRRLSLCRDAAWGVRESVHRGGCLLVLKGVGAGGVWKQHSNRLCKALLEVNVAVQSATHAHTYCVQRNVGWWLPSWCVSVCNKDDGCFGCTCCCCAAAAAPAAAMQACPPLPSATRRSTSLSSPSGNNNNNGFSQAAPFNLAAAATQQQQQQQQQVQLATVSTGGCCGQFQHLHSA